MNAQDENVFDNLSEPDTYIITRVAHTIDGITMTEQAYFSVVGTSAKDASDALSNAIARFQFWVICGSPDLPRDMDGWVELMGTRDGEQSTGIVANDVGPDLTYTEVLDTWYEVDWDRSAIAEVRESVPA